MYYIYYYNYPTAIPPSHSQAQQGSQAQEGVGGHVGESVSAQVPETHTRTHTQKLEKKEIPVERLKSASLLFSFHDATGSKPKQT